MLSGINILLMPNKYLDPSTLNQTLAKSSNHSKQSEDNEMYKQDTYAVVVCSAKEYAESAECELIDTSDGNNLEAKYEEALSYVMKDKELPYPGYGRRGNKDDEFPVTYMAPDIKAKLDEIIQKGRENSIKKMSAASMLEKLKEDYPGRVYILPFESTIKNYISSKLQQDKNGNTGTGGR
ncbi:predicted protein [Chaetoceros tenuissimus]|uniref:Uncharacterized protein n=1 Tax=Chaetoceros tenuissimus TaxID=426638 RepID=A0AAD3CRE6_9STRA|nr:predicted protein [Chaetoceros tenuissimus]